jgi:hypothetical protein
LPSVRAHEDTVIPQLEVRSAGRESSRRLTTLCVVLAWVAAPVGATNSLAQDSPAQPSVEQFFDRFVTLGRAYDPAVADLYADDATIQSVRRDPDGTSRTLRFIGEPYKRLIRNAMPLARQRGDRDRYSDMSVSAEGPRARIRCTRYNELKRYTSPFELVLERSGDSWQIIEEYSETRASGAAGVPAPSATAREPISPAMLQAAADKLSNFTPMMVDSVTELTHVGVEGLAIVYEYRLVGIDTLGISPDQIRMFAHAGAAKQNCAHAQTRGEFLDRGVVMRYKYFGGNRQLITTFDVTAADCQGR